MKRKGFTLIEMMIVIAIVGLLLVMLTPALKGYVETTKKTRLHANFESVHDGMRSVLAAEGESFYWLNKSGNIRYASFNGFSQLWSTESGEVFEDNPENESFLKKVNEFMPKNAKILLKNSNGEFKMPDYMLKYDCFHQQDTTEIGAYYGEFVAIDDTLDTVELYEDETFEDLGYYNVYTRNDGESISIIAKNLDDDPDTYSVIFVPKADYTNNNGVYKYSTEDVDIIILNEGYYTVNGGELKETIWK